MVQGIPYDSPEGRAQCGALTAHHARRRPTPRRPRWPRELGPFPRYEANREAMLRVIRNHRRAAYNAPASEYEGLTITPVGIDPTLLPDRPARGRPRASATACSSSARSTATATPRSRVIAPTGTIGLVMDCDTTGIEPDFALVKFKKLAGGGYFKIINASVPPALRTARLHADADRRHRPLLPRRRHARRAARTSTPRRLKAQGLHRRGARQASRAALPAAFELRFASTAGRSATTSSRDTLGFTEEQLDEPGFDLLDAPRLHAASRSTRPTTTSAAP